MNAEFDNGYQAALVAQDPPAFIIVSTPYRRGWNAALASGPVLPAVSAAVPRREVRG
jgi:hypothetical protein